MMIFLGSEKPQQKTPEKIAMTKRRLKMFMSKKTILGEEPAVEACTTNKEKGNKKQQKFLKVINENTLILLL